MTFEVFLSLLGIAHAAAWTPGPNNTIAANSGARYGIRATLPHIAGIGIGFPFMAVMIALGLGAIFEQSPFMREALRWGGVIVLLILSYKIATAPTNATETKKGKPFTFWQTVGFQWINPKAWVNCISINAQFVDPSNQLTSISIIGAVFIFVGFTSPMGWALLGKFASRWLTSPGRLRLFNITMASLMALSVIAIAFGNLV